MLNELNILGKLLRVYLMTVVPCTGLTAFVFPLRCFSFSFDVSCPKYIVEKFTWPLFHTQSFSTDNVLYPNKKKSLKIGDYKER